MATSLDIATLALKHLGVIAAEETPASDDATEGTDAYDRLYAELQEDGFAVWASASIPRYLEDALMRCVAARLRPIFFTVEPALHEAETMSADQTLKRWLRRRRTEAPVEIQDY